jgi:hypothetical protein
MKWHVNFQPVNVYIEADSKADAEAKLCEMIRTTINPEDCKAYPGGGDTPCHNVPCDRWQYGKCGANDPECEEREEMHPLQERAILNLQDIAHDMGDGGPWSGRY